MINEDRVTNLVRQLPPESFMRSYVRFAGNLTDGPVVYHLGVGLSILAALAPEHLEIGFAGRHLANFWCVLVGLSRAARKTECINIGTRLLGSVAQDRINSRPGSVEGLEEDLAAQGTRLVVYPEFGEFLSRSQGNDNFSKLREKYTELYDGIGFTKKLSKREVAIPNPRLSLLGGVTPQYIDAYTDRTAWLGGFFGRFFVLAAERERTYPELPRMPEGAHEDVLRLVQDIHGSTCGPCIGFTYEAGQLWDHWYRECAGRFRGTDMSSWAEPAAIAAPNFALKACLLFAFDFYGIRGSERPWVINEALLNLAIEIAEMHLTSMLWVLDQVSGSPYARMRRAVLEALHAAHRPLTLSGLLRKIQPKMSKADLLKVIETLKAAEEIHHSMVSGGLDAYSLEPFTREDNLVELPLR